MILSIRHSGLRSLFEKGSAAGIPRELKGFLLLWLSVLNAASDLRDLSISNVSQLEKGRSIVRLHIQEAGMFSFRFVDGDVLLLDYRDEPIPAFPSKSPRKK